MIASTIPSIHFAHANGFPALTYQYFLQQLAPYPVSYVQKLGHNGFRVDMGWQNMQKQVIHSIETQHSQSVVGIGHSLGATLTLFSAFKRPDLYRQIILLDPALFCGWKSLLLYMLQKTGIAGLFPPASRAKKRRTSFVNRMEAHNYFQNKQLFKNFSPLCFDDYIQYGLVSSSSEKVNTHLTLAFSARIEAQVFQTMPLFFRPKQKIDLPVYFIYASNGLHTAQDMRWWHDWFPQIQQIRFEGGHLFPLEQPNKLAELIKSLIKSKN